MSNRSQPIHRMMSALNGSPQYQESLTVTSGATVRNATAFSGGEFILLQSDEDFYVRAGTVTTTVSSANGVKVVAGEKFVLCLRDGDINITNKETHICCIADVDTATIKVFKLV